MKKINRMEKFKLKNKLFKIKKIMKMKMRMRMIIKIL